MKLSRTPILLALCAALLLSCASDDGPLCDSDDAVSAGGGFYLCDELTVHRPAATTCARPGGCNSDGDCAADELCDCMTGDGECVFAGCRVDAECGGHLCARSQDACETQGFFCQSDADRCTPGESGCVFWTESQRFELRGASSCP